MSFLHSAVPTNPLIGWATEGQGTTGGGNAEAVVVTSMSDLKNKAGGSSPGVIHVQGQFKGTLKIGSNKTIIGLPGAKINNGGPVLLFGSSSNIIVRNMHFESTPNGGGDMANISGGHHIWIDHCNLVNGGDGLLDIINGSDNITVSWCKIWYTAQTDHQKAVLIGNSDGNAGKDKGKLNVTFHHNWWAENVLERMPRVRFGKVHVFNSLFEATPGWTYYAIRSAVDANVRSEHNIFKDFSGYSDSPEYDKGPVSALNYTFGNSASILESIGDVFINCTDSTADAEGGYGGAFGKGTAFSPPYPYILDSTEKLEELIKANAGPQDKTTTPAIPFSNKTASRSLVTLHNIEQSKASIKIKYLLRHSSPVSATLHSTTGERILHGSETLKKSGHHEMVLHLDAAGFRKISNGFYLLSFKAGNQKIVIKEFLQ